MPAKIQVPDCLRNLLKIILMMLIIFFYVNFSLGT